jgi:hypothetical protein
MEPMTMPAIEPPPRDDLDDVDDDAPSVVVVFEVDVELESLDVIVMTFSSAPSSQEHADTLKTPRS